MIKAKLPHWFEEVKSTNKAYTKDVTYGQQKFTSINAQHQILKATDVFGLYGDKWGVRNLRYSTIGSPEKPIFLVLQADFFYTLKNDNKDIEKSFPMATEARFYTKNGHLVDDLHKKLLTDLTTKALSKIGFNSDIFLGMYEDQKYMQNIVNEKEPLKKLPIKMKVINQMRVLAKSTEKMEDLLYIRDQLSQYVVDGKIEKEINKLVDAKEEELQSKIDEKA